jgi:hypothetical protein
VDVSLIVLGGVGGLIPDAIRIVRKMHAPATASYLKTPIFYVGLLLLVGLGCLAAWIGGAADPKQALAYGYGAPEFFSRLGGSDQGGGLSSGPGGGFQMLRNWWAN